VYFDGLGLPQDYAKALRWFRLAADQGEPDAQYNLGLMRENGQGAPQDSVEAHMWLNLAAAQSSGARRDAFAKARELVAEGMTAEQITEAQSRAREWTPTPEP
jgi:TPR repeat protein